MFSVLSGMYEKQRLYDQANHYTMFTKIGDTPSDSESLIFFPSLGCRFPWKPMNVNSHYTVWRLGETTRKPKTAAFLLVHFEVEWYRLPKAIISLFDCKFLSNYSQ